MTVVIPEAVSAIGGAASSAEGVSDVAAGTAKKTSEGAAKKPSAPREPRAAKKAAPAPRARTAPAPVVQKSKGVRRQETAKSVFGSGTKKKSGPKQFKLTAGAGKGSAAHKLVVAEFIFCVVLIGITPILMRQPGADGHLYVPNDFVRLTAVSLLFFILALLSNSPTTSRFAAAFGGLVTLGVAFNATQSFRAIANLFINAGTNKGGVQPATAGTASYDSPSYKSTAGDTSANQLAEQKQAAYDLGQGVGEVLQDIAKAYPNVPQGQAQAENGTPEGYYDPTTGQFTSTTGFGY